MNRQPTGTVTFLFTDLEGSTRLWEEHPEAMRDALKRHDELLVSAVETHGGYLVKTTGDGIHAAFATAEDAVQAATAAQEALTSEVWGPTGPLRVRMGVHTGSAELRDGDYYGPALNRAARLMAAAHGGQIVISHVTEELVRDELDPTVGIVDLGEHRLRDLGRPERVFQVTRPGGTAEFPPLRSLDAYPGNLPPQRTAFVGRQRELTSVPEFLEDVSIVTLTGPGGVGKTRLAIQVAAESITRFPDGAWFVDLAPVSDGRLVPSAVRAALRIPEPRTGPHEDAIVTALRSKTALIVLDNCEHIIDAAARLVEHVATNCLTITLLMTSREALGVGGEQVVPVMPLPLPANVESATLDEVRSNDAVTLFVDRAHAARHGFALNVENVDAVCELSRRLDGIPLAIELAAARINAMSPSDMVARLDERFRLLTQGRRTALSRHQTLRGAIDWSYTLLDDLERLVFARLSVFAGGFTLEGAEAVVSDDPVASIDVLDLLSGLVAKSMVVADERDGVVRYRLLETLREYGQERLADLGEVERLCERHAAYYLDLAETAAPHLKGPDDPRWLNLIEADLDNLRAALQWTEENDRSTLTRVVIALAWFWIQCTHRREGRAWLEQAIAADDVGSNSLRPVLLAVAGRMANDLGREDAEVLIRRSIDCSAELGEPAVPLGLSVLAVTLLEQNRAEEAQRYAEQAVEIARRRDSPYELIDALNTWTAVCNFTGEEQRAREISDEAVERARGFGNEYQLGFSLLMASIARSRTDPAAAIRLLESSEVIHRYDANRLGLAKMFQGTARTRLGDFREAARDVDESLAHFQVDPNEYYLRMATLVATGIISSCGASEPAVRLLSAIEGFHEHTHLVGTPYQIDAIGRIRARLEQVTDPGTFAAEWAVGREMTLDDAVTLARAELSKLIDQED